MIPRECYKFELGEQQMNQEQISCKENLLEVDCFTWDGEIKMIIKDAMFPYRSYVSNEIMWAINMVKSNFIEAVKILSKPQFIIGTVISLCLIKELESFITSFNRQSWRIISPYILKDKHLSKFAKELHWCIFTFTSELGISEIESDKFATIISHIIEYDNAYRFRIQDLFSAIDTLNTKSIQHLIKISKKRDNEGVGSKLQKLAAIISLGLHIPKIKKAYNKVCEGVTLKNLQYKEEDIYWVALREDYLYQGKSKEQRIKESKEKGWNYPNYPFKDKTVL